MKKLLILFLVLGLSSVANALVINLTVSSPNTTANVDPGTVVTVNFTVDQNLKIISPTGADQGIDFTKSSASSYFATGTWTDPTSPGTSVGTIINGNIDNAYWASLNLKAAGTVIYTCTLTINDNGSVSMASCDNDEFKQGAVPNVWYTVGTITGFDYSIIPEPVTIVLLGLGGLFLRRRK